MRRCSDTVCSLLVTGLLVAFLVGCSKSEETRQAGKPQIGQTNAVTAQCINTQTGESSPDSEDAAENSISDLKAKAERGDAEAQYKLGLDYESGVFGVAGQSEAVKWYQKAADQGWTSAVARLGAIYGEADSPLYEPKESFRLTERAAAAGDVRSQVSLGFKYVEGLGVATNSDEGLRWITRGIAAMEDLVAKAMARTNARFEAVARQVDINICACRLAVC